MARYEQRIEHVENSTFAFGEGAAASSFVTTSPGPPQAAALLAELLRLLGECDQSLPGVAEMRKSALAAQAEVVSPRPDKRRVRGLVGGIRTALGTAGSGLVQAGALADAVAKITEAVRHL